MISVRIAGSLRSIIALVTLGSAALGQSVMLHCPMAFTTPVASIAAQGASHGGHADHPGGLRMDRQVSIVADGATTQSVPSCAMPIGCGSAGITAPRAPVTSAVPPTNEAPRPFTATQYTTVFPAHESPPPRLPV